MNAEGHVVICGLERLGLRVAEALLDLGEKVTVLATGADPDFQDQATRAGAIVIDGRGSELSHLRRAGIEMAVCLVLTEDSDLGNLHAALAAREICPDLRVVIRMFNMELADRAERLLPGCRVISASLEAAPRLAAEALGTGPGQGRVAWGRHLEMRPDSDGALVELANGLHLHAHLPPPQLVGRHRGHRRMREFRQALRAFFDRRLAATVGAIATLIGVSVVIFHRFDGLGWIDSLYFTVTTASTTGYGDFNLMTATRWLKLYDVAFMLAAAVSLALLYALMADAIVGARILEALGVPRGRLRGHVIVVGLGNTGFRLLQHFDQAGVEVAAAELMERSRFVQQARRMGIPVLTGDGRFSDSLHVLSVAGARAVVAVTDDDVVNLEVMLTARELNPQARLVARLFDPHLAERAQKQFGIHACHSVSDLAAPAFVAAALGQGVVSTLHHGTERWLLGELMVMPGSRAAGMAVTDLERLGVRLLAVRDGAGERWTPSHPATLEADQTVLVAASRSGWEEARSLVAAAEPDVSGGR